MVGRPNWLPASVRDAASVILIRERTATGEAEIFMLRRHSGSSFMARSFVFPGGVVEPTDRSHKETATRELFEEAGVLLTEDLPDPDALADMRRALHEGASLSILAGRFNVRMATHALRYFAHWITPSIEKKRFSATFFVAELPRGQVPQFDNIETVDEVWVTPDEALSRSGELRLPPPQVRTMYDLREAAAHGPSAVLRLADDRAHHPHPVLPRPKEDPDSPRGFALLLPWDPEYTAGWGDALEIPADHPLGTGPSRFTLGEEGWQHLSAPIVADESVNPRR
jgi:8-oxo-dGTP pyrophosphatase MutT (NUDIX family)